MDLNAVAVALAAVGDDATVNGQQVTGTPFLPDAITTPHWAVCEFSLDYDRTFNGLTQAVWTCRLFLTRADDESGQQQAQSLASTGVSTISAAIATARGLPGQPALSGAADDLHLRRVQGPRLYQVGAYEYYGLEFTVFVMG